MLQHECFSIGHWRNNTLPFSLHKQKINPSTNNSIASFWFSEIVCTVTDDIKCFTEYFIGHKWIACVSQRSIKCFIPEKNTIQLKCSARESFSAHIQCSCHSTFMTVARYKAFCVSHKGHSLYCHEILFIVTVWI